MSSLIWKHICQRRMGKHVHLKKKNKTICSLFVHVSVCLCVRVSPHAVIADIPCVCFFNPPRLYLNLVLGNVNVTLLSNQAK